MKNKIGVFDSGIGGLTVLDELKKILPNEEYIYYADTANNPYGEKSDEELLEITVDVVKYLISKKCKIIVIACNTATTKCMKKLREIYPNVVFVGTVPAIKMASDNNFKMTLVMATPATTESLRTKELIRDFKRDDQEIMLLACKGLADSIESGNDEDIDNLLEQIFYKYKNMKIDSIVLGCTHYPLIKNKIQNYFRDAVILDGSIGVAREVKRQLEKMNMLNNTKFKVTYIDSTKLVK